jgi:muramoyltetrapeptide carboxypeptidase
MMPLFLKPNSLIHIISPSGAIDAEYIDKATIVLEQWGFRVSVGQFAKSKWGRFAGTKEERISDLQLALDNPEIDAILCSRGGYGVSQIIDKIDFSKFTVSPKWLIGFSDITILHNAITLLGIASIHSIMAKDISELAIESNPVDGLKQILMGNLLTYFFPNHELNHVGNASGKLIGGNLSVLAGMRGTPYDLVYRNNILFIEDIGEKPYQIDRMIQNLRLGAVFNEISGLVVGQFSDCEEDELMNQTIYEIINEAVGENTYPVCFDFQAGHIDNNLPLILGADTQLVVSVDDVRLSCSL